MRVGAPRHTRWRPALRGPFPRIVATDAAQVGEDPVDDADVLDHGDTFHFDATLGAEQRVDLEDPARLDPRGRAQLRRRDLAASESSWASGSARTSTAERGAPLPLSLVRADRSVEVRTTVETVVWL